MPVSDPHVTDNLEVDRLLRPVKLEVDANVEQADASSYPVHVTLEAVPPPSEFANGDIRSGLYRSNLFVNRANGINGVDGVNGRTDSEEELERQVVHCKYLVGCDGAHSWVRRSVYNALFVCLPESRPADEACF